MELFDDVVEKYYMLDLDRISHNFIYPLAIIVHAGLLLNINSQHNEIYKEVWGVYFILLLNFHFLLKFICLGCSIVNGFIVFHQHKNYNVLYPLATVSDSKLSMTNSEYLLSVWTPKQLNLHIFVCFNPFHLIIHLTVVHWYYKSIFILLSAIVFILLIKSYEQLIKDKQTLYELVLTEYNVKMVHPLQQLVKEEEYSLLESPNSKKKL